VSLTITLQRMDLGECPKIHDPALRADFEREQAMRDHFYDLDVSFAQIRTHLHFTLLYRRWKS
jgi:hypothetical protein